MIASIDTTARLSQSQLLKLSDAASLLAMDPQALRRLADRPDSPIRTIVLDSGHRRFVRSSLTSLMAPVAHDPIETCDDAGSQEAIPVCLLARVSSIAQSLKRGNSEASDLERQIQRLRDYQKEHYPNAKVFESFRIASGCNFRSKELHDVMRLIWSGKLKGGALIATYFDRVLRIGWEIVELACEEFGVKVVYISPKSDDDDPQKEMVDELLAILTMYTARASGAKTRENNKVFMDPELLKRTWRLNCGGHSVRSIMEIYKAEGLKDAKGRAYTTHVIFTLLKENKNTLVTLYGFEGAETSLTQFLRAHVVTTGEMSDRVMRMDMLKKYKAYCLANGLEFMEDNKSAKILAKYGWKRKLSGKTRSTLFMGVKLVNC